jgi:hypothetical protein
MMHYDTISVDPEETLGTSLTLHNGRAVLHLSVDLRDPVTILCTPEQAKALAVSLSLNVAGLLSALDAAERAEGGE